MKNFWMKLNESDRPFFVLAPMYDVTDVAFRAMIVKYGKPDVIFTEFISCEGLLSEGREALMPILKYSKKERPVVAQLFGATPKNFEKCARIIDELGFDGVDINMGCPDKSVEKQGAGAKLIENPQLAMEIIEATKKGAGKMSVSVKTRVGYNKNEIEKWLPILLKAEPDAISIHGRTRKEMSDVPARWDIIKRAVEIRNDFVAGGGKKVLIIGNGDVRSVEDGNSRAEETGVDGVMVGRATLGNPWFFSSKKPTTKEKLSALLEHTKIFEKKLGDSKNFSVMKKHFKAYVSGFNGAKELRIELMETNSAQEIEKILKSRNLI